MDIEEFEKKVKPRARRSQLEPFLTQIFALREKGYTNLQVCEWLAGNGTLVTQESVRKFIKSREKYVADQQGKTKAQSVEKQTIVKNQVSKGVPAPKVATVEQLKEITRGHFDPDQFNDDSE